MGTTTVRIEGVEELQAKLRLMGSRAEAVLLVAATEGAAVIRDEARRRAPGPHIEMEGKKSSAKRAEVTIGPDAAHWYYGFFETGVSAHPIAASVKKALAFTGEAGAVVRRAVGHTGFPARPFLRPAIEAAKEEAAKRCGEILRRAIEAVR